MSPREGELARVLSEAGPRPRRLTFELAVPSLQTREPTTVPVHIVQGRRPGPTLLVCAAIHGDELTGIEVVRRLLRSSYLKRIRGTLLAVPIVNVFGFLAHSRYLPDRRDLNRSFPGRARGSLAGRLAHAFMTEVLPSATHIVDLHSGAVHRANLPQVRGSLDVPEVAAMARAFDVPVMLDATVRDGSLRAAAQEAGKPIVVYEAGEALRLDRLAIRAGLRGCLRVMREIGMLRRGPRTRRSPVEPVLARSSTWVRAPDSGLLVARTRLGEPVRSGKILAHIVDPFGAEETPVPAPRSGIVIGDVRLPLVHEGDALFHIATPDDSQAAQDALSAFQDEFATTRFAPSPTDA
jgi:predicted deacylase